MIIILYVFIIRENMKKGRVAGLRVRYKFGAVAVKCEREEKEKEDKKRKTRTDLNDGN